jgi:hypothetical protein
MNPVFEALRLQTAYKLDGTDREYDVRAITTDITNRFDVDSIDDVPDSEFWLIAEAHALG